MRIPHVKGLKTSSPLTESQVKPSFTKSMNVMVSASDTHLTAAARQQAISRFAILMSEPPADQGRVGAPAAAPAREVTERAAVGHPWRSPPQDPVIATASRAATPPRAERFALMGPDPTSRNL